MIPYIPTKYAKFLLGTLHKSVMNFLLYSVMGLIILGLVINNNLIIVIPCGLFGIIIILKLSAVIIENSRIIKYCKINDITTDYFNIINANKTTSIIND